MTRIIMHGCNGKMGQTITNIVKEDADAQIVAGIDLFDGIQNEYPVFKSLADCDVEADVVIDFTAAPAVDALLDWCEAKGMPVVLCSTGLTEEQVKRATTESIKKTAVLKSANMSLGINVLLKLLKDVRQPRLSHDVHGPRLVGEVAKRGCHDNRMATEC